MIGILFIDFLKMTTFWDIPKWNRGSTIWDRGSLIFWIKLH